MESALSSDISHVVFSPAGHGTKYLCQTPISLEAMTELIRSRLPSTFTSLYRLFLRTSSASVLQQRQAKRNLRKLWRPVFDDAVLVIKKLQNAPSSVAEQDSLEKWLKVWETRSMSFPQLYHTSSSL